MSIVMQSESSYINDHIKYLTARVEALEKKCELLSSMQKPKSDAKKVHHLNDTFKQFVEQVFVQPLADVHTDKYKKS